MTAKREVCENCNVDTNTQFNMQNQLLAQYINTAHAANVRGEYAKAVKCCKQAFQLAPDFPEGLYNLGIALAGQGKRAQALDAFEQARTRTLKSADAQNSIGLQLVELGAYVKAEQCFNQSIKLVPDFAFPYSNMGKLRESQKRFEEAETFFRKAIELQPEHAQLHSNLAGNLYDQKKYEAAEASCSNAIALDAKLPAAWFHLGSVLQEQKRFKEAEATMRKVLELDAKSPKAWSNLGSALHNQYRYAEAEAAFRIAIGLDASVPKTWSKLGTVLNGLKRYKEAAECFGKCLKLNPDAEFVLGDLWGNRMRICDWRSFSNDLIHLKQKISQGRKISAPFTVLGLIDDLAVQRKAAEIWAKNLNFDKLGFDPILKYGRHNKIRIGYFSADFHIHPVTHLIARMFEQHNRGKFELVGFSFGPDKNDEMRKRVAASFDRFIDVRELTDKAIAQLSRELEIDIAVDLNGYTTNCRTEIFSYRAAPVQVSYLGYAGTQGVDYIDYLIADRTVISKVSQPHYSEKIVYLPNSFLVNDGTRKIVDRIFAREDMGLPTAGLVYCCFNSTYKVTPVVFQGWMRILRQVENSVLWLYNDNPVSAENLRKEAKLQGIDPGRLVFTKPLPLLDEHLARHYVADLFLDTLPYNAHTTAVDALWTGLPVLTCVGEAFASRVAASLLTAIGLPELITTTQEKYEALAVELGTNLQRYSQIKQKLEHNRFTTPLFDTAGFTRHIEAAYTAMYERYQNDLPPDHIYVDQ